MGDGNFAAKANTRKCGREQNSCNNDAQPGRGFNRCGSGSSLRAPSRLRPSAFRDLGRSTTDRNAFGCEPRLASIFTCPGRLPASADRLNPTNKSCNTAAPFYDIVNAHGDIVYQQDIHHEELRATHRQNRPEFATLIFENGILTQWRRGSGACHPHNNLVTTPQNGLAVAFISRISPRV